MKKKVLIIFGGKSGEHEVSNRSAKSIEQYLDRDKFEPYVLGITSDGRWHFGSSVESITSNLQVLPPSEHVSLPTEPGNRELTVQTEKGLEHLQFDVIFPIIHGTNGEDGKLQGLLEISNLPYVGAGVIGSALAMDKVIQKQLCDGRGFPQTQYEWFWKHEWEKSEDHIIDKIEKKFAYPIFVKPANSGSSVGITKAHNKQEFIHAVKLALEYDLKILVEEAIQDIAEVEVGVLGNHKPKASVCGSIKPKAEFYDYQTKYVTDDIIAEIPAEIPADISEKIRATAVEVFQLLNCKGMARVDFFYQPKTGKYFLNEINTLPGFTSTSMYPKLWEATGLSYTDLLSELIVLAIEDWKEKQTVNNNLE
ncbi:MAG: D-alanine--D-alanine ligase family protein [Patescibacteria group bacterium]